MKEECKTPPCEGRPNLAKRKLIFLPRTACFHGIAVGATTFCDPIRKLRKSQRF